MEHDDTEGYNAIHGKQEPRSSVSGRAALRQECEWPTEDDLDYMEDSMQRATKQQGFEGWWKNFVANESGREAIRIIIMIWEAGRIKAHVNTRTEAAKGKCRNRI